jgi:hypothetical protein
MLFRVDAKDTVVQAVTFADGTMGYTASYTITGDTWGNICQFYSSSFKKEGWTGRTSRRTDEMCTIEAQREGLRVAAIVLPGEAAAQISLTILKVR